MSTKKKPSRKSAEIKALPDKMSVAAPKKLHRPSKPTRLVLTCTEREKRYIKMLALREGKTASEYLLSFARKNMPKAMCDYPGCDGIHKPNKLTEKVLRESERGENIEHHATLEDFWKSMEIDPNAEG